MQETPEKSAPTKSEAFHGSGDKKKDSGWRDFGSFVGILAIAGVLAFLLISFVFRSYSVDGPSMETTLQNEDKLIIWKVPRTIARVTGNQWVPNRGDVIVFDESNLGACGQQGERQLIKRVIGLPGERVVVKDGTITVFNKDNPAGFSPDATLPYNQDGHIPTTNGNYNGTLAKNQIFVSGDNRPDSCDSRNFGPIATDQVIGKLVIRLLPANNIKLF
jgi:signal peptidase I